MYFGSVLGFQLKTLYGYRSIPINSATTVRALCASEIFVDCCDWSLLLILSWSKIRHHPVCFYIKSHVSSVGICLIKIYRLIKQSTIDFKGCMRVREGSSAAIGNQRNFLYPTGCRDLIASYFQDVSIWLDPALHRLVDWHKRPRFRFLHERIKLAYYLFFLLIVTAIPMGIIRLHLRVVNGSHITLWMILITG